MRIETLVVFAANVVNGVFFANRYIDGVHLGQVKDEQRIFTIVFKTISTYLLMYLLSLADVPRRLCDRSHSQSTPTKMIFHLF